MRNRLVCVIALGFSLPAIPAPVMAQACMGLPQGSGGAIRLGFGFPEGATSYAIEGMAASADAGLFFTGVFGITSADTDAGVSSENLTEVGGGFAFEVESLAPSVSLCPTIGLDYGWIEDLNLLSIPFGVGVGATLPLGRSGAAGLTPFIVPTFFHVRLSIDDLDGTESDTFFGINAGMTLNADAFVVGGAVSKLFEEGDKAVFSIFVGAAWP